MGDTNGRGKKPVVPAKRPWKATKPKSVGGASKRSELAGMPLSEQVAKVSPKSSPSWRPRTKPRGLPPKAPKRRLSGDTPLFGQGPEHLRPPKPSVGGLGGGVKTPGKVKPVLPGRSSRPALGDLQKRLAKRRVAPKVKPKEEFEPIEEEILEEIPPDAEDFEPIEEEILEEIPPDVDDLGPIEEEILEEIPPDAEDLVPVGTPAVSKEDQDRTKENEDTRVRLEKSVTAVGHIHGAVDKARAAAQPKAPEAKPTKKGKKKGKKKSGGFSLARLLGFTSKSEDDGIGSLLGIGGGSRWDFPTALEKLGTLRTNLGKLPPKVAVAEESKQRAATSLLPAAKAEVDGAAEEIDGKVEGRYVEQLGDVAVGLEEGLDKMALHALSRKDIQFEDLKGMRKIGAGGSYSVIFATEYLGMAPMGYKLSKGAPDNSDGSKDEDDVEKEIRTLDEYSDPNILKSGGLTKRGSAIGMTMELAKRGDLDKLNKKMTEKGYTTEQRLLVMRHLMKGGYSALDKVHAKGIAHADIKGANFLLGNDGQVRLMDFGLSETEAAKPEDRTKRIGTASFMAPEVVTKGVEKKSDIWSMAETMLKGVFGEDSMDIWSGEKTAENKKFNIEQKRAGIGEKAWEKDWRGKLEAKTRQLKDSKPFVDFLQQSMRWDPAKRLTAKTAFEHKFFEMSGKNQTLAKKLVEDLYA